MLAACGQHKKSELPLVQSVADVIKIDASSIPLTDNNFLVHGKVTSNISILSRGAYKLSDLDNEDASIVVLASNSTKYKIGDSITIRISKTELARLNSTTLNVYKEL